MSDINNIQENNNQPNLTSIHIDKDVSTLNNKSIPIITIHSVIQSNTNFDYPNYDVSQQFIKNNEPKVHDSGFNTLASKYVEPINIPNNHDTLQKSIKLIRVCKTTHSIIVLYSPMTTPYKCQRILS